MRRQHPGARGVDQNHIKMSTEVIVTIVSKLVYFTYLRDVSNLRPIYGWNDPLILSTMDIQVPYQWLLMNHSSILIFKLHFPPWSSLIHIWKVDIYVTWKLWKQTSEEGNPPHNHRPQKKAAVEMVSFFCDLEKKTDFVKRKTIQEGKA